MLLAALARHSGEHRPTERSSHNQSGGWFLFCFGAAGGLCVCFWRASMCWKGGLSSTLDGSAETIVESLFGPQYSFLPHTLFRTLRPQRSPLAVSTSNYSLFQGLLLPNIISIVPAPPCQCRSLVATVASSPRPTPNRTTNTGFETTITVDSPTHGQLPPLWAWAPGIWLR